MAKYCADCEYINTNNKKCVMSKEILFSKLIPKKLDCGVFLE